MNDMLLLGAEIGHYFEMKARAVMRMRRIYEKFIWKLKQVKANTFFNILLIAKNYFY